MDASICRPRLLEFADLNADESPLYREIARSAANDAELIDLIRQTPERQPIPVLFLAIIHELLLQGSDEPLASFYPSCTSQPLPVEDAGRAFREFCLAYQDAILDRLSVQRIQTNEIGRCAYLYPALCEVHQLVAQPLALVEIGTSAGLNLGIDRYRFDYGEEQSYGNEHASLTIRSTWKGELRPRHLELRPVITCRCGVDINVIDVHDNIQARWLEASIWPDQRQRRERLRLAIECFRRQPITLFEGNAAERLPNVVESAPADSFVCVFHTHTLNQFSETERREFAELLNALSRKRPIGELSAEWIDCQQPQLVYTLRNRGRSEQRHLANVHQHGSWIEWLNREIPRP